MISLFFLKKGNNEEEAPAWRSWSLLRAPEVDSGCSWAFFGKPGLG